MRAVVFACIAAGLTLAAYGLVRYPGLRSGLATWVSVAGFLALLLGYAVLTLALSSGQSAQARVARRNGLAGGLAVGAAWLVIFSPGSLLKGLVIVPLACVLLGPACIAALRLLRDFHNSGSTDLATYAVSDNLGSGLVLLLIVPIAALALGFLGAGLAAGPTKGAR